MNIKITDPPPSYFEAIHDIPCTSGNANSNGTNSAPPSYDEAVDSPTLPYPSAPPLLALLESPTEIENLTFGWGVRNSNSTLSNQSVPSTLRTSLPSSVSSQSSDPSTSRATPSASNNNTPIVRNYLKATLKPFRNFVPGDDASNLRHALEVSDKNTLVMILCHRTSDQRLMISKSFQRLYGLSLLQIIKKHLRGSSDFSVLMRGLAVSAYAFIANSIYESSSYNWLCYIIFVLSNEERAHMKHYFRAEYGKDIVTFLQSQFKDHHPDLDVTQITLAIETMRDESDQLDKELIIKDVRFMKAANQDIMSKEMAKMMFYTRSSSHINEVCACVQRETRISINTIVNQIFGDDNLVIPSILIYSKFPAKYFASILKSSMKGLGTNSLVLSMVVVMRCEIDMIDIKRAFELENSDTLRSWIKDDTSGHYKYSLYALIGEKRTNH